MTCVVIFYFAWDYDTNSPENLKLYLDKKKMRTEGCCLWWTGVFFMGSTCAKVQEPIQVRGCLMLRNSMTHKLLSFLMCLSLMQTNGYNLMHNGLLYFYVIWQVIHFFILWSYVNHLIYSNINANSKWQIDTAFFYLYHLIYCIVMIFYWLYEKEKINWLKWLKWSQICKFNPSHVWI